MHHQCSLCSLGIPSPSSLTHSPLTNSSNIKTSHSTLTTPIRTQPTIHSSHTPATSQVVSQWNDSTRHGWNSRNRERHAIVEELVGFGARVHTCARNEAELGTCLREWNDSGFEVTDSICDVSFPQQREKLLDDVSDVFQGKLNILINNVGTNIRKPMTDFTPAEFSSLIDTNIGSTFHICQLAYPLLKASGVGSVVFIFSVSGFVSLKSMSVQGATKGAINQLTRNLACESAEDNIRSNMVAPWYIRTSMVEQVILFLYFFNRQFEWAKPPMTE